MHIRQNALTAVLAMIVMTVLLGIAYPLAITGISQVAFPGNANGQQVTVGGRLVGSKIIGQQFADVVTGKNGKAKLDKNGNPVTTPDPRYFLGPNNLTTEQEIAANIKAYLALERPYDPGLTAARVPVDAADSSASGVDPDISVANARIQAHRIAAVHHVTLRTVDQLVATYTTGRSLGIFGEPGVNVLELNLALNRISGSK